MYTVRFPNGKLSVWHETRAEGDNLLLGIVLQAGGFGLLGEHTFTLIEGQPDDPSTYTDVVSQTLTEDSDGIVAPVVDPDAAAANEARIEADQSGRAKLKAKLGLTDEEITAMLGAL